MKDEEFMDQKAKDMTVDELATAIKLKQKEDRKKTFHIIRHKELHKSFDELLADFIRHKGKLPSKTTVSELMEWSHNQTKDPTEET